MLVMLHTQIENESLSSIVEVFKEEDHIITDILLLYGVEARSKDRSILCWATSHLQSPSVRALTIPGALFKRSVGAYECLHYRLLTSRLACYCICTFALLLCAL